MLMLGTGTYKRVVDESGTLRCPVRDKDMEYERCLACPWLADIETRDGVTEVTCRVPRRVSDSLGCSDRRAVDGQFLSYRA